MVFYQETFSLSPTSSVYSRHHAGKISTQEMQNPPWQKKEKGGEGRKRGRTPGTPYFPGPGCKKSRI